MESAVDLNPNVAITPLYTGLPLIKLGRCEEAYTGIIKATGRNKFITMKYLIFRYESISTKKEALVLWNRGACWRCDGETHE